MQTHTEAINAATPFAALLGDYHYADTDAPNEMVTASKLPSLSEQEQLAALIESCSDCV